MEATPLPSVDPAPDLDDPKGVSFADVVHAWHARGEPVPVAVVASVFDDLLGGSIAAEGRATLSLEDVLVTADGAAGLERDAQLPAIFPVLMEAMGADLLGDQALPPAARGLFERLTSDDPAERPSDAEQLRTWLRESLGSPATHEEVRDCVLFAVLGSQENLPAPEPLDDDDDDDVHELETLPPHPAQLPTPPPAAEESVVALPPEREAQVHQVSTDVVRKRDVPRDLQPRTDVERATHLPEPLPDSLEPASETVLPTTIDGAPPAAVLEARAQAEVAPEAPPPLPVPVQAPPVEVPETAMPEPLESELELASAQPTVPDERRRVVITRAPRPVSVVTAPKARASASPSPFGGDSLIGPAEARRGWVWVGVAAAVLAAVYFMFFK